MKTILLLFSGLLASLAVAAELPPLTVPEGVGVNIHFTRGHERDLDLIAAAGFKFIRMDFSWAAIEREKNHYDWSAYDELTGNLAERGLRAIYILDYSNPLYEQQVETKNPITGKPETGATASPQHPESIAAFARWAAAAAKHFRGRHIVWEIWNEPNIFFWQPKPDVHQYVTLALATFKAIRDAVPDATIIGPASSGFPWEFLETLLQAGALNYLDGVSVHPYREYSQSPETARADFKKLRSLIDRYAPEKRKRKIPILSGEWGYATHTKEVSLETQARFVVRQQLANVLEHVPISIWYDWVNDGPDPAEREHNFGIVNRDLTPKPSYTAIRTMTRELNGYQIVRRYVADNSADFILVLKNSSGEFKLATWTAGSPHDVSIPLPDKANETFTVTDISGNASSLQSSGGALSLRLTGAPKYLALGRTSL